MNKSTLGPLLALAVLAATGSAFAAPQTTTTDLNLPNAGFEQGEVNWALQDPLTMSHVVPEAAHTGTMGLRVTDNDTKRGSSAASAALPAAARQGIQLTFWARTQTAGGSVALWFLDGAGKFMSAYQPVAYLEKTTDWKRYQVRGRAPVGAKSVKIWVHTNSGDIAAVDLDDFQLQAVSGPEVETMPLFVPPDAPAEERTRKAPPYIILKLDDLAHGRRDAVDPHWQKVMNFLKERKIRASFGIVTNSLEGDFPIYFNWIKEQQATGLIEFWCHGYTHQEGDKDGRHFWEFSGPSYDEQKRSLLHSQELAREKLGFTLPTFGAPFNVTNEDTAKALEAIPDYKVWLYGDNINSAGKVVLHRSGVNIEYPTFVPDVEKMARAYSLYPQDRCFVMQGHPGMWTDARYDQFVKIVDFLTAQNAVFVTPSEYAALPPNKFPAGPVPPLVLPVAAPVAAPAVALQPVPATAQKVQAGGAATVPTADAPLSLIANGDFSAPLEKGWTVAGKTAAAPTIGEVKIDGAPFTRALQMQLAAGQGAQPWATRLVPPKTAAAIARNDMLLVQFWARSTPNTRLLVVYQQSTEPYEKSIRQTATLRPQWQKYTFYAPAKSAYAAGGSNFELQLGQATGKLELTGLSVQNLGPLSVADARARFGPETFEYYGGADHDDNWIPAAQARIEKYRKADVKIRVVDAQGKPVRGAQVTLKQTKSAFRWGSAVGPTLVEQSPAGDQYRAVVKKLFNTATIENQLKWRATDGNPANQKLGMDMLDWLGANGLAVRGHTLVWGGDRFLPERLKSLPADATREAVQKRVTDAVTATRGKVYVWDVVNEAGVNTQLWDKIGWDQFSDVYRRAREANPGLLLAYNDYNIANEAPDNGALRQKVEARIQALMDAKAPLDVLGDQAHIGVPLTPIPRVLQIWDDWARKYRKPIEVTEFDTNVADDAIHEKYVRDFLTAAFSDPNIDSFVMWGFWAKTHFLGEPGALFRADWSPRPAELTYEDLVLNKWRTNQTLTTDATGAAQTRGFLGDYDIQVTVGGKTQTARKSLDKNGLKLDLLAGP